MSELRLDHRSILGKGHIRVRLHKGHLVEAIL